MQSAEFEFSFQFASDKELYLEKIRVKGLFDKYSTLKKCARDLDIQCPWALSTGDKCFRFLEFECTSYGDFLMFIKYHFGKYLDQLESFFGFCHILAQVLEDWHEKPGEFELAVVDSHNRYINQATLPEKRQKILTACKLFEQDGACTQSQSEETSSGETE